MRNMKSSANLFKNAIAKAYTTQPNVKLNSDTMSDANKYMSSFKESMDDEDNDEFEIKKKHISNKSAKNKFSDDLKDDPDFIEFKIRNKYKYGPGSDEYSFGTPHAVYNDPFINKKKYKHVGKEETKEEKLKGGVSDKKTLEDIAKKHDKKGYYHTDDMISSLKKELKMGIKVEMEHTKDKAKAKEIAMDHLWENPSYYTKLKKVETKEATSSGSSGAFVAPIGFKNSEFVRKSFAETPKLKESESEKVEATEATGSGSVGGYSTPAMWAKSTNKKDWGPSRKTQYPGGGFVKIKKRCTKFPYCNQGDINNLKISKNESVKEAIENVAKKYGLSEDVIMTILEHEYEITSKRIK
jgi:hypothetical protein